jgi:hypothetical protein
MFVIFLTFFRDYRGKPPAVTFIHIDILSAPYFVAFTLFRVDFALFSLVFVISRSRLSSFSFLRPFPPLRQPVVLVPRALAVVDSSQRQVNAKLRYFISGSDPQIGVRTLSSSSFFTILVRLFISLFFFPFLANVFSCPASSF